jgi:hypothetical protein
MAPPLSIRPLNPGDIEGVRSLLCYGPTFNLLRVSHGRTLGLYTYSVNKLSENYYTQRKKMRDQGELNPRSRLWYHARWIPEPIQPYYPGDIEGTRDLLCYSPTFPLLRVSRGHTLRPCVYSANNKVGENYYTWWKKMCGQGELNPRSWFWYHARWHLLCQSNHKTQVI